MQLANRSHCPTHSCVSLLAFFRFYSSQIMNCLYTMAICFIQPLLFGWEPLLQRLKFSTQFQIWISRLEHLICPQCVRYGSIKQLQYNKRTECKEGNHSSGTIHINYCRISVKGIRCGLVYKHKRLELIVDDLLVHECDDCGLTD